MELSEQVDKMMREIQSMGHIEEPDRTTKHFRLQQQQQGMKKGLKKMFICFDYQFFFSYHLKLFISSFYFLKKEGEKVDLSLDQRVGNPIELNQHFVISGK